MPVATLTKIRWSTSGHDSSRSPSAMMFTSLSTSTGASKVPWNQPGTSKRSQPGMIGGLMGRPRAVLDRAGQPDADREQVAGARPSWSSSSWAAPETQLSTASGPSATRMRSLLSAWMRPVRSLTAMRTWRRADVDAEHDAAARRDRELRRRAATGRDRVADGADEAELHEGVDAEGDGRSGEARHRRELGARAGAAVAEDLEEVARDRGAEGGDVPVCSRATYVGHSPFFHICCSKFPGLVVKGAPHSVVTAQLEGPARARSHGPAARSTD